MVCLRADQPLVILSPAIVHGTQLQLSWSLVLRSNPIGINHWVRLHTVRGPVTHDEESELITKVRIMVTRSKLSQSGSRAGAVPKESAFIPSRQCVEVGPNDPAELYTYAATSTLSGAGRGLFARGLIKPASPIHDEEYIGEYMGGENITADIFQRYMFDLNPDR